MSKVEGHDILARVPKSLTIKMVKSDNYLEPIRKPKKSCHPVRQLADIG
jgi:hypothetical protein